MNTVTSQNLEAQVVATTNTPLKKVVSDATSTIPATSKNTPVHPAKGQNAAVNGNTVPDAKANAEQKDETLENAVSRINGYVQQVQRDLQFSVDDDSGRTVIKVIDSESKEIIRQIPEEVFLQVAQSIEESFEGTLLEVKV